MRETSIPALERVRFVCKLLDTKWIYHGLKDFILSVYESLTHEVAARRAGWGAVTETSVTQRRSLKSTRETSEEDLRQGKYIPSRPVCHTENSVAEEWERGADRLVRRRGCKLALLCDVARKGFNPPILPDEFRQTTLLRKLFTDTDSGYTTSFFLFLLFFLLFFSNIYFLVVVCNFDTSIQRRHKFVHWFIRFRYLERKVSRIWI